MRVVILAQGPQDRMPFEIYGPKHLLPVAREPVVFRTLRMLGELGFQDIVAVTKTWEHPAARKFVAPDPCHCILKRMMQTLDLWGKRRTFLLLGDVVWSWVALQAVMGDRRSLLFAGARDATISCGELFAMTWAASENDRVAGTLRASPCGWEQHERGQPGHLRYLLRALIAPLGGPNNPPIPWHELPNYLTIEDYTCDIDTPTDWQRMQSLEQIILADRRK